MCFVTAHMRGRPVQCENFSRHVQMLTLKTALILSRSSSLQGSALGPLVHNEYLHYRCRGRYHSGVSAAACTAAKPGMHGMTLSIVGCTRLAQIRKMLSSISIVFHAILMKSLYACAWQSAWKRLARHYSVISCLMCAVAFLQGSPLV